jgi:hypothetical protein
LKSIKYFLQVRLRMREMLFHRPYRNTKFLQGRMPPDAATILDITG